MSTSARVWLLGLLLIDPLDADRLPAGLSLLINPPRPPPKARTQAGEAGKQASSRFCCGRTASQPVPEQLIVCHACKTKSFTLGYLRVAFSHCCCDASQHN
ncbi:hypothetical protein FALCPG4_000366 [Fusarium falciforme]